MNRTKRRRVLQAALGLPLVHYWRVAGAQSRTLSVAPAARAAGASAQSLLTAPRHALVIGNSSYAVGPLKNPANDARAIGEALKSQGFEVTIGLDLKRAEMADLIAAYGAQVARTKPMALFYFAGHGLQLAWRNYLVPVDAAIKSADDVQKQCVDVNSVIEGIGKAANPMNVIILDACRDDPFGGSQQKGLSQLDAPPGTLLAFATSPGNVASDGDGANGLYTENLLREMKVPEAKIEDVFKRVRLGVRRRSSGQQIPWESTSLEEDFWFIPPKEIQKLAAAEAERVRKEKEAERLLQERIEKAQLAEAERLKKEAQAARVRQEAEEKRRREQLEREYQAELERRRQQEDSERAFLEEAQAWEKADGARTPAPLEEYLRRYPSGRFAELAQLQLDELLRRQGEKPVQIASSAGNPFTQGTARADLGYQMGDTYAYVRLDRDTREPVGKAVITVTEITDTRVIFNDGRLINDRLGNTVRLPNGDEFTPRQDQPLDYAVGKKWSTRYKMKNEERGQFSSAEFEFRITGRERITVPAGTFDCFVIEGNGWSVGHMGAQLRLGLKRWMAPEKCRRPVVIEQFRLREGLLGRTGKGPKAGTFAQNERQELVAFKQA